VISRGQYFKSFANVFIEGEESSLFYGYQTDGIYQTEDTDLVQGAVPGDVRITDQLTEDTDGDGVLDSGDGVIDLKDRTFIGNPNPDFVYGFNINFKDSPNISPTIWSTVADQINIRYYFCNARTTDIVWVDLHELQNDYEAAKFDVVTLKKDDKGIEMPNEDKNFENFIKKNGSINNLFTKVEEDPFKLLTA
jgi:hypothetical protein